MDVIHRAQIVIGDSIESPIVIGYRAEIISAFHQALFDHFAEGGPGVRATFHVSGTPDVERHFFLTPHRPIHFMYPHGRRPELHEDAFKIITTLIRAKEVVHFPLDAGTKGDSLALMWSQDSSDEL